jgi:hypothetical protein
MFGMEIQQCAQGRKQQENRSKKHKTQAAPKGQVDPNGTSGKLLSRQTLPKKRDARSGPPGGTSFGLPCWHHAPDTFAPLRFCQFFSSCQRDSQPWRKREHSG